MTSELSRRRVAKLAAAGVGTLAVPRLSGAGGGDAAAAPDRRAPSGTSTRPTGRMIYPRDRGCDKARQGWDGRFSTHPLAIAFCASTRDLVNAVTWAPQNDVALRVRSGRHNLEGWSGVDGGLVIDVSELKNVRIDAGARAATRRRRADPGQDPAPAVVRAPGPERLVTLTEPEAVSVSAGGGRA